MKPKAPARQGLKPPPSGGGAVTSEQREPLSQPTYTINEHGCVIETTVWAPARLADGRCCGRKPIEYKRSPDHHFFCPRCNREYLPTGVQRQNWAYKLTSAGNYVRERPLRREEEKAAGQNVSSYGRPLSSGRALT
jgi:hypothetical protein